MGAFETIRNTTDRVEAELWLSALEGEGVPARIEGFADAALLGVSPEILPLALQVPTADVARANEVLEALKHAPEPHEEPEPPPRRTLRRRLAAGLPFLIPAGGHFYARRPWTGAVLLAAWLCSLVAAAGGSSTSSFGYGLWVLLIVADLVGGVRAVGAYNRGVLHGGARQLAAGLAWVLTAAVIAGAAPLLHAYERRAEDTQWRPLELACSADAVRVTNRGDSARAVTVTVVRATRFTSTLLALDDPGRELAVGVTASASTAALAPGADLEARLQWEQTGACSGATLGIVTRLESPCELQVSIAVGPEARRLVRCELDGVARPLVPR